MSPHSSACWAGIGSPSSAISSARALPAAAGTRNVDPPSGHQPDVHEGEAEDRRLGRPDQVAGERQRASDADGGPVHRRDDRLGQLPDALDDRVVALPQQVADVRRRALPEQPRSSISFRSAPDENPRPGAGDQDGAHRRDRPQSSRIACRSSLPNWSFQAFEPLGTVQRDLGDRVFDAQLDVSYAMGSSFVDGGMQVRSRTISFVAMTSRTWKRIEWLGHAGFRIADRARASSTSIRTAREGSPPADVILITHDHFDHFSRDDVVRSRGRRTTVIGPPTVTEQLKGTDRVDRAGRRASRSTSLDVAALPAYNTNKLDSDGQSFPPPRGGLGRVRSEGRRAQDLPLRRHRRDPGDGPGGRSRRRPACPSAAPT